MCLNKAFSKKRKEKCSVVFGVSNIQTDCNFCMHGLLSSTLCGLSSPPKYEKKASETENGIVDELLNPFIPKFKKYVLPTV